MQPRVENYIIVCQKCKGHSRLAIVNGENVMYKDHTPIISARLRPDMNWGFECQCGNDSRVAPEEKDNLNFLVQGGEHAIEEIARSLVPHNEKKFIMEHA